MSKSNKFSPEVRERSVKMVLEHQGEYESQWAAIVSVAAKVGCTAETLRGWVRQHERDSGKREGLAVHGGEGAHQGTRARSARAAPGQRDPAQGVGVFCPGGARPPLQAMKAFIDAHRDVYGVEPICRVLPIAPSTYYAHAARKADPELRSQRAKTDEVLVPEVERVWKENFEVDGVRNVCARLEDAGGGCDRQSLHRNPTRRDTMFKQPATQAWNRLTCAMASMVVTLTLLQTVASGFSPVAKSAPVVAAAQAVAT